ncbi:hypothetical protein DL95DRAFT_148355 [Leptodontidium sp. 2 PMI_412]|nr:hypothetical protein DL95DRAFT_148355 [Leptodontidium sp. 2 PMI_412]
MDLVASNGLLDELGDVLPSHTAFPIPSILEHPSSQLSKLVLEPQVHDVAMSRPSTTWSREIKPGERLMAFCIIAEVLRSVRSGIQSGSGSCESRVAVFQLIHTHLPRCHIVLYLARGCNVQIGMERARSSCWKGSSRPSWNSRLSGPAESRCADIRTDKFASST